VIRGGAYEGGLMDRSLRGATSHNILGRYGNEQLLKKECKEIIFCRTCYLL
jgi:hypothetical protein